MHWRNFERLTTEFFRRQGYEVDLGPEIKHGCVDVRVWADREAKAGPLIMLIQCKRTKDNVGIETVKAFWADAVFERAESGLIATTAAITRDSKAICEARHYPLTFAEETVVDSLIVWARALAEQGVVAAADSTGSDARRHRPSSARFWLSILPNPTAPDGQRSLAEESSPHPTTPTGKACKPE